MRMIALLACMAATACANPQQDAPAAAEPLPAEPAAGLACAAESVQYAIGQKSSPELGSKLVKESGSASLRWLPPRSAATMDYRADRLNVHYNDDMIITRVNCG